MKTLRYLVSISMVIMAVVVSGCGQNKNVGVIDVEKVVTESPKIKVMNEPAEDNQNKELKESKRAEIENLKVKIKKLEEHLISEVKDEVVKMAITRKITIVMDKVFLNITAIDLTDDVIAELKRKNN